MRGDRGRGPGERPPEPAQAPGETLASRAKPGQMALQPSGTAPVQPGPTLAV